MEGRGDLLSLLLNPLLNLQLIHLLILLLTHGTIMLIMGMDTHMPPTTIILMLTGEGRGDLLNQLLILLLILMLTLMLTHGFIILRIMAMDTPMDTTLESKQVPIFDFQHIMDQDTAQ